MFQNYVKSVFISMKSSQKTHYISSYQLLSLFLKQNPFITHSKSCFSSTSSAAPEVSHKIVDTFRTNECMPSNHSSAQLGMFYTIPTDIANKLFVLGGFNGKQMACFKTFREMSLMVRPQAIEVMDYLKRADYLRPINRYVIYGSIGSGKTFILNHILHFGFEQKFLLIYCPNPTDWTRYPEETAKSDYKSERMDTPIDAAVWLQLFRTQNSHLLNDLDLRATKRYVWSQREITEPGDPLKNILDHGINRIKHASDCMAVLLKEIKSHASEGKCRVLVVVNRANVFYEKSKIKYPDRSLVEVNDITICRAFKTLFTNDWTNGAVVATVCKKLTPPYRIFKIPKPWKKHSVVGKPAHSWGPFSASHLSHWPKDLLTDIGFKDFDPFVPIEVSVYSDKEMESCLDYYNDRLWIQRPEAKTPEGRNEIKFLTAFNPLETYEFCSGI